MESLAMLAGGMLGLAADPLLLIGCLVVGRLAKSRGQAVLGGIGVAFAAEALLAIMTINDAIGPYPFGRMLVLRAIVAVLIALALHGLAVLVRKRRQAGA